MKKAAQDAVDNLGSHCKEILSGMNFKQPGVFGPEQTFLIKLGSLASSASFYEYSGLESGLKVSETIGVTMQGDPEIGSLAYGVFTDSVTRRWAVTALMTENGATQYFNHYILGPDFSSNTATQQGFIIIHELLHALIGSHASIQNMLGINLMNGENSSTGITEWLMRDKDGKKGCNNR
jgi:hypothetical protein